ncbi:KH domain-containing protein [Methanococcus aeolicus]|uniref:KH type 1 domain protein n=1 Tax=Methanococcus aeolicus (strain ATCC BAA-1280 / DSM 17508 / OCM 812 / Nankai-3) TaxID=419665 RepID=A6UUK6_META3|nr:KH domain-containing protein [Methanococcus aeolicus]ABR56178.1 KH type 1 domain protein [Methanococcus aeolicus Nankai-3]UXM84188.1 KH domain-containing protein [Methanococcus aeolicus]
MDTAMNVEVLKIPKERIGVIVGKGGEIKNRIEKELKVEIDIEEDGEITIFSTKEQEDPLATWKARDIIKAIGRGFNPEKSLKLISDDYIIEIIDITEHASSDNAVKRLKGRVIGSGGKSRRYIEELTDTDVSVYGKTIAVLGDYESVQIAKEAINMILRGNSHSKMYKYLERHRQDIKRKELELWK